MHLRKRLKLFNRRLRPLILHTGRNCSGIILSNIKRMWAKLWARENVCVELLTTEMLNEGVVMVTDRGKRTCLITIQTSLCPLMMNKLMMMVNSIKAMMSTVEAALEAEIATQKKKT